MSRIDELIQQLCPDGVEYKPLGELCFLSRGKVISKDYLRDHPGIYPVFSSQTADDGVFGRIDSFEYDGEYLTWTTDGANAGSVFFRSGRFNITNVCGLIKLKLPEIRLRFLFYWLRVVAPSYVNAGMGNPKLMSNVMGTIQCPVPPLPVQEEIVRILDKFTALEAELEAELEARRKQYEFYRDQLLTFGDEVEWKPLGEIVSSIASGKNKTRKDTGIYCVYGSTGVIAQTDVYMYKGPCILIARVGANAGFVYLVNGLYDVSDNALMIRIPSETNIRFIYYLLTVINLNQFAKGGGSLLLQIVF